LEPASSLADAFEGAHLAVIANNHLVFGSMPIEALCERMGRPGLVYDFWNHFDARELTLPDGIIYMGLGAHGITDLPVASA
jgi:hypothetical protein